MRPKTVLVVDDDPETLQAYAELLQHSGFRVRTASNGGEAILAVHREGPDLILMDVMMPVVGGLEAAESLRRFPATSTIPIIAITGTTGAEQDRMRALCDDLIAKPCIPAVLLQRINDLTT
jgi:CheY-like chemotaxis protein